MLPARVCLPTGARNSGPDHGSRSGLVQDDSINTNSSYLPVASEPATPDSEGSNGEAGDVPGENPGVYSTPQAPVCGLRFETDDVAVEHYRVYALRRGFTIRKDYSRPTTDGQASRLMVVCAKAGKPRKERQDDPETENQQSIVKKRRRSRVTRTECPAHMYVKRTGAWWYVKRFDDNHNHPLLKKPSLTKFFARHRNIPEEEKDFIRMLHDCNIPTSRQMQLMGKLYGQLEDVPYTTKDIANERARFRLEHRHTDMQETIAYFKELKEKDPDFYWAMKLDEEDRVENLFWVDGPARKAYAKYNDVVSFDTTYLTNAYKMPCAPFIGINNHGQSIQFGCGFLRNELTDSFIWLFTTFLDAMGGVAPKNIITDQDFAMRAGIDSIFQLTRHRNCRWHIMKNARERPISKIVAENEELHAAFLDCIDNSWTGKKRLTYPT